jgi:hypothetical protein
MKYLTDWLGNNPRYICRSKAKKSGAIAAVQVDESYAG